QSSPYACGGPAPIRLKTTANPLSRFETLADWARIGAFLDAAPYRYMLKLVVDEFSCSKVENRWDLTGPPDFCTVPFFWWLSLLASNSTIRWGWANLPEKSGKSGYRDSFRCSYGDRWDLNRNWVTSTSEYPVSLRNRKGCSQ